MKLFKPVTIVLALALVGAQLFACGNKDEAAYDYSKGLDKNGYFANIKASDIVTLPQYKGIDIDASVLKASDEDLQAQIDGILDGQGSYEQIKDRAVADGDTVNIDYVGSVGGVNFEGGSTGGAGTNVTIGVTQYIDDFLEQLIGHKPGENFDINVTFPADYGKDELDGKDAVFNITINFIQGDLIDVELNDEIAIGYGFETVDAMIEDIKSWLISNQKFDVFTKILLQATCENIPQPVLDYVINYDLSQYSYYATLYGVSVDDWLVEQLGYESKQAYIDTNMEVYKQNAIQYLAAQAIAEIEGLVATSEDIKTAGYTEEIDNYGEPYIKQFMLFQEIIPDFIIENGIIK